MAKTDKKGHSRLTKRQLSEKLSAMFAQSPDHEWTMKEIFRSIGITTHPAKMLVLDILDEMTWDDFVKQSPEGCYRLNQMGQVQEGIFRRKTNGKNSFIADGTDKPVFVAERNSMMALDGDRVRIQFLARRKNHIKEAQVIEILERAKDTFVGDVAIDHDIATLQTHDNLFDGNIIIPRRMLGGAKDGDKVTVKIKEWPSEGERNMIGKVTDILGKTGENTAEMHAILAQYNLPYVYPKVVEDAANKISGEISADEIARREDFRKVFTCTIDPIDAKDFDDALSIQPIKDGLWEVGVHIADVSHYVKEGDIIDKEARARATSIYLVDRTVPMLPERLCNFVCSLRPDEDKLCYSVVFNIDNEATVHSFRIVHTVIRSNRRYAYEEVQKIIDDGCGENSDKLLTLHHLAQKLREKRMRAGAVKFDREEMRFDIDADGKPTRCYFHRSTDANKLIEEFMLLANRTVAESIGHVKKGKKAKTFVYRVHDTPDPLKLEQLGSYVAKFGYKLKTSGRPVETARSINSLIDSSEGKAEEKLIQMLALRAMMKAKYTVHNIGHFGLAFDYYTHFTSPIRRYPDTMVHRLLTRYEEGGRSVNRDHTEDLCQHCSDMEILATNAERDSIRYKMVEYMIPFVGSTFKAHISGIQSYGIYCEIDENHCEGLIPMRDLDDDYYDLDERNYCLVGRRFHHCYRLGDAIDIIVARADLKNRRLDFAPADAKDNMAKPKNATVNKKNLRRKNRRS